MNSFKKLFLGFVHPVFKGYTDIFLHPHFWIISLLIGINIFVYYTVQFSWVTIFQRYPLAQSLVIWEFMHSLIGVLFYIPLLYSVFVFWWRGALIVWFVCLSVCLPHIYYYYHHDPARIFNNIFYLSIPIIVLGYISIEMKWREKDRNISAEREKERQNYLLQVFKAQEDERKRVAQEIHDDSLQRLAVIASDAELLTDDDNLEDLSAIKKNAESIKDMIISVSQDLRRISMDLRPIVLDDLGLIPALRLLVDDFKRASNINTKIKIIGENKPVSKIVGINIFRIVQEALNNIKRHSEAINANITIQFADEAIKVVVEDDGKGFSMPKTESEFTTYGKLGLIGMEQRTQFLNGTFLCQSELGNGTIISVDIKL